MAPGEEEDLEFAEDVEVCYREEGFDGGEVAGDLAFGQRGGVGSGCGGLGVDVFLGEVGGAGHGCARDVEAHIRRHWVGEKAPCAAAEALRTWELPILLRLLRGLCVGGVGIVIVRPSGLGRRRWGLHMRDLYGALRDRVVDGRSDVGTLHREASVLRRCGGRAQDTVDVNDRCG